MESQRKKERGREEGDGAKVKPIKRTDLRQSGRRERGRELPKLGVDVWLLSDCSLSFHSILPSFRRG